jgi:hypothetical protein
MQCDALADAPGDALAGFMHRDASGDALAHSMCARTWHTTRARVSSSAGVLQIIVNMLRLAKTSLTLFTLATAADWTPTQDECIALQYGIACVRGSYTV